MHILTRSLDNISDTLKRRHELAQALITELRAFDGNPMNISIQTYHSVADAQSVLPIFEKAGFRVELRFVNQGRHYFRFFQD